MDFLTKNESTTIEFDFDKLAFQKIDEKYRKIVFFNLILSAITSLLAVGLLYFFEKLETKIFIATVVVIVSLFSFLIFYHPKELKNRKYTIQDGYVVYCSGLFSFTMEVIPFNRIQHTSLEQGWLSKKLNLAKVVFYTAGSIHETISIQGLNYQKAVSINAFVLNHLGTEKDEEQPSLSLEKDEN